MRINQPDEEGFVDFLSFTEEGGDSEEPETTDQKKINKQKLEQNFIPLIDSKIHTDIVGENMKITVNKEGDTINSIDIECQCGCKSRLIFEYKQ